MMIKKNDILNSPLEISLRILILLRSLNSERLDIDELLLLDYYILHINDFDYQLESIHPSIPNRKNEIFIRRQVLIKGISILQSRNLINTNYTSEGISYSSNEITASFVNYLESSYVKKLEQNIDVILEKDQRALIKKIKYSLFQNTDLWLDEFNRYNMSGGRK